MEETWSKWSLHRQFIPSFEVASIFVDFFFFLGSYQRHIGDLGNILVDETGAASGTLLAYVPLWGEYGIRGRAVVVHAGTDDLGLGGDDGSRAVGNAGARPGCGTIK